MEPGSQGVLTVAADGSLTIVGNALDSKGSNAKNKIVTASNSDGSVGLYMVPVDGPNKGQMFLVVPASSSQNGKGWAVRPTGSNSVLTPLFSNILTSNVNFVQAPVPIPNNSVESDSSSRNGNLNSLILPQNNNLAALHTAVVSSNPSPQVLHNSNQVKIIANGIAPSTGNDNIKTILNKTNDMLAQRGFQTLAISSTNSNTFVTPGVTNMSNVTLSSGNFTLNTSARQSSITSTNQQISNSATVMSSEADGTRKNLVFAHSSTVGNASLRPVFMFSHSAAASLGKSPHDTTKVGSIPSQTLNTASSINQLSSTPATTNIQCSAASSLGETVDHSYSVDSSKNSETLSTEKRQLKVCYPAGESIKETSGIKKKNSSVPIYVFSADKNVPISSNTTSGNKPIAVSPIQTNTQNISPIIQTGHSTRLTNTGVTSVQSSASPLTSTPRTSSDVKVIVCNKAPVAMYSSAKSLLNHTQAAPRKIQVIRKHVKQMNPIETTSNTLPCKIGQPLISQTSGPRSSTIMNLNSIAPDAKIKPKIVIKSEEISDDTPKKMVFKIKNQKYPNISLEKVSTVRLSDSTGNESQKKIPPENKNILLQSREHDENPSPKNNCDKPLIIDSVFSLASNDCSTEYSQEENQNKVVDHEPDSQKNTDFVFREFDFLSNFQGVVLPDDAITDSQIFSPCYVVLETMRMQNMKLKGISDKCTKKCRSRVVQSKSDIRLCIQKHREKRIMKPKKRQHVDTKNIKKLEQRSGCYSEKTVTDSRKVDSAVPTPVKPATLRVDASSTLDSTVPTPVNPITSPVTVSSTLDKKAEPKVPSTGTTNSTFDNKSHNPNYQKFFLIKIDNKSVLIPVNAGNSPKAFVLDSSSEKALGISSVGQRKGSTDGGTSSSQSNTGPTRALLPKPGKSPLPNITPVASDLQPPSNVVSKVKTEPVTMGYGDEPNSNSLCTKVKQEPLNRGYPDEVPSLVRESDSHVKPSDFESSPPKLQKMNDPPSSASTPPVLSKEERISSLKELMRQKERELNELRKKLAQEPQPVVDMDF